MEQICFVGTYTKYGESKGIYVVSRFNNEYTIKPVTNNKIENPTYLIKDGESLLYAAINEPDCVGGICSYKYEAGALNLIDKMIMENTGPCHLALDITKKYIVSSHYHAGNLQIHEVHAGNIINRSQVIDHKKYETPEQTSHVHFATFTPNQKSVLVCDLGLDALYLYPFNSKNGLIDESGVKITQTTKGAGPRHAVFNATGNRVYTINELSGTINTYKCEGNQLILLNEIIPTRDESLMVSGGAIKMHPTGKYLYVTQRGDNVLNCFAIDKEGKLSWFANVSVEGEHPRDFSISSDGKQLWVANQESNNISIFNIAEDGSVTYSGQKINVPKPVYVEFL